MRKSINTCNWGAALLTISALSLCSLSGCGSSNEATASTSTGTAVLKSSAAIVQNSANIVQQDTTLAEDTSSQEDTPAVIEESAVEQPEADQQTDDSSLDVTDEIINTEIAEESSDLETTNTSEDFQYNFGVWDGNTYTNSFSDTSLVMPDGYEADDAQTLADNMAVTYTGDEEEYLNRVRQASSICDLHVSGVYDDQAEGEFATQNISIYYLSPESTTPDMTAKSICQQYKQTLDNTLKDSAFKDVKVDKVSEVQLGHYTYESFNASFDNSGNAQYQTYFVREFNGWYEVISMDSTGSKDVSNLFECFQ